ncbi:gephyrin-like molybdotransferase Glp [Zavarzinia sp.]|uniref:molybdopterin molybdotransferase MoeA n=1 Tax=Zavarzinia sp. TaxID=2027920 RepID=UPI00356718D7
MSKPLLTLPLLTLAEAQALIARHIAPCPGSESLPVIEAVGRVLASDVSATRLLPAADNSAVDGYALRTADAGPRRVIGRAAAGAPFAGCLGPGEAVRIFTGALLPAGADAVAMQECADVAEGMLRLAAEPRPGANIRRAGEVLKPGERVLAAGLRLSPLHLGLLADLGAADVLVRCRPRVALISSGDELVPAGTPTEDHQVVDSNRPMLREWLRGAGCRVTDWPILPDRRAVIAEALHEAAASHDLVVTTAGMSVGDEDHVPAVLKDSGGMIFHRLAIKPGRPVGLGRIGQTPVLGLPGNPGAAAVVFTVLGRGLVRRLAGETPDGVQRLRLPAGFAFEKAAGDRIYLPGRLTAEGRIERLTAAMAGNLAWSGQATGLIEMPEPAAAIVPGDPVAFIPFPGTLP